MDGISDQSQGPRRQHSMISRFPAVSRASGEALGVGQSQRFPVSSSELAGPQHASKREVFAVSNHSTGSDVSASKQQIHGARERSDQQVHVVSKWSQGPRLKASARD